MSVKADLRAYAGNNVLLPGSQVPRPATILVSAKTGKIIDVREGRRVRADYADIAPGVDDLHWVDVGDKYYLLPGLVEYVGPPDCPATSRAIVKPLLFPPTPTLLLLCVRVCLPRLCAVRMCTSTSLGGRTGRASRRARAPRRPGVSPPSWTCRSTRSPRPLRWRTSRPNAAPRARSAGQTLRSGAASSQAIKCAHFNAILHSLVVRDQLIVSSTPSGSTGSLGRCWCQGIQMLHDRKWC
jgi:hypothetical protein